MNVSYIYHFKPNNSASSYLCILRIIETYRSFPEKDNSTDIMALALKSKSLVKGSFPTYWCGVFSLVTAAMAAIFFLSGLAQEPLKNSIQELEKGQVMQLLREFGEDFRRVKASPVTACQRTTMGSDYGAHTLCDYPPGSDCQALSFGIQQDWTFDSDLVDRWNCTVFALDPSVTHPSNLHKGRVYFIQAAANTLEPLPETWHLQTSVPSLRRWLNLDRSSILKMDCEGCEYALAMDVEREEPNMWYKIDQFAVEIHISRYWIKSFAHVRNLALLYAQLRQAGLALTEVSQGGCAPSHEELGCPSELLEAGVPCYNQGMCINLLFARHMDK
jgi:hypothetical protein